MYLRDDSGREFKLSIIDYEFPDASDDWLLVGVGMKRGEDERKKRDPCLTVGEAFELADWLEEMTAVEGNIGSGMPNLTEANLQIDILKASRTHIELRASFIFESRDAPPVFEHVDLKLSRNELKRAASDFRRELEKYPHRESQGTQPERS